MGDHHTAGEATGREWGGVKAEQQEDWLKGFRKGFEAAAGRQSTDEEEANALEEHWGIEQ